MRPDPCYGQVVRYSYLWASEAFTGGSEAEKHRPCAIVVALKPTDGGARRVMLCGITHTEPRAPSDGVQLPAQTKKELGLDDKPSWAITSEVNLVDWLDPRFEETSDGGWDYGLIQAEVMCEIRDKIMSRIKSNEMDVVNRPEIDKRVAGEDRA